MEKMKLEKLNEIIAGLGEDEQEALGLMLLSKNKHVTFTGQRPNLPPYDKSKPPFVTVCKTSSFDAAHNNPKLPGKCAFLHGHTYRYEVYVRALVQPDNGLVLDFRDLKVLMKNEIEENLDHKYLNEVLPFATSAEHVCIWIYNTLKQHNPDVCKVRLWENETCFAEVTDEDLR